MASKGCRQERLASQMTWYKRMAGFTLDSQISPDHAVTSNIMAKILLVEDDSELAERLGDWFTLEGHSPEVVTIRGRLPDVVGWAFEVTILDSVLLASPVYKFISATARAAAKRLCSSSPAKVTSKASDIGSDCWWG